MFKGRHDRVGPAASLGALVPAERHPRMSERLYPSGSGDAAMPQPPPPGCGFDNWPALARSGFIAQLAATALDLPQTRRRRRASSEDAMAAYEAAVDRRTPRAPGTRFSCFA